MAMAYFLLLWAKSEADKSNVVMSVKNIFMMIDLYKATKTLKRFYKVY
jgi:hypothetical protein